MKVTELFQDMAGKWRARVDLGTESQFFKFQEIPTDEEILAEAQKFIDDRAAMQAQMVAEQAQEKTVNDNITAFNAVTITKAQAVVVIQLLIAFIKKKYGTTN